jgi:L-fucose dehydrogenase
MDLQLKNKVIIVTGGAKGIGESIVRILSSEGSVPVIVGRNETDNLKLVRELASDKTEVFQVVAQLNKPEQSENAVKKVIEKYGRIDGLVMNAGQNNGVGLENGNYESFIASLRKNLIHCYLMAHFALPELKKQKGAIVNITVKTTETRQGKPTYSASDGGCNTLRKDWAVELLKYGIRVNTIVVAECWIPPYEMWIQTLPNSKEKLKDITSKIPFDKQKTTSEKIANMTAFLLSEKSSHTTGQLIHVEGDMFI